MSDSTPVNPESSGLEVTTWFVRSRNALFAKADFSQLYVDYYLHLSDHKIKVTPEHDALFKRALAGYVNDPSGRRFTVVAIVNDRNAARAGAALDYLVQWVYRNAAGWDPKLQR